MQEHQTRCSFPPVCVLQFPQSRDHSAFPLTGWGCYLGDQIQDLRGSTYSTCPWSGSFRRLYVPKFCTGPILFITLALITCCPYLRGSIGFVLACLVYMQNKASHHHPASLLQPLPVPCQPTIPCCHGFCDWIISIQNTRILLGYH